MTEATGLMAHNWGFAIFLLGVVGLCAFMLGVSSLLGSKAWGRSKNEPFESGMLPTGGARLRLSAKFYSTPRDFCKNNGCNSCSTKFF